MICIYSNDDAKCIFYLHVDEISDAMHLKPKILFEDPVSKLWSCRLTRQKVHVLSYFSVILASVNVLSQ